MKNVFFFYSLNQVVLWDKIIRRGQNAQINLRDIATKYYFWDDGEHLRFILFLFFFEFIHFFVWLYRSKNVTLTLAWNTISNAGRLLHIRANGSTSFVFPDHYTTPSRSASPKSSGQE
jgi:signal peptidase complex subunit 3